MAFINNKVALVTGGASGIGFAIVTNLLENGAKGIGILDISEESGKEATKFLRTKYEQRIYFIQTDVTKEDELRSAFIKTIAKFGNLDIVVNNAGIVDECQWKKVMDINLGAVVMGTYLAIDEYLPKHKSTSESLVLNIASVCGLNTYPNVPTYCLTKHGVVGLGKALGHEEHFNETKVRVITICPGMVNSPLVKKVNKKYEGWPIAPISKSWMTPNYVGEQIMTIMNEGKNGSVWVIEDEEPPYEVEFLYRTEMKRSS